MELESQAPEPAPRTDMTCTMPYARTADTATTLRDFAIEGAAELGECDGARSFRAVRRCDGRPVLLHKFRPAAPLTALGRLVNATEIPDFRRPFVTRFTDLFAVAGSAYLVEPLPPCSGLGDVWRHVLQKRPHQSLTVMAVLIRQMISITRRLLDQGRCHGALELRHIVLAPAGCFGVLAARVECEEGVLWLRRSPENPLRADFCCLVEVLGSLLDLDSELSTLRQAPMRLPVDIHRRVRELLYAIRRAERTPGPPARS